jgi:hypothetical protein
MIKKLSTPIYSYVKGGAATISCTLDILADDNATVLATTVLGYTANLDRVDFKELVISELTRQAQEYIDQLKVVAGLVYSQFGTPDFTTAIGMILTETEARIEV